MAEKKRTLASVAAFLEEKNGLILAVFIVITLMGGIYFSVLLGSTLRFIPDEEDYFKLAENILRRGIYSLDGVTPTAYRPPGYPWVLSSLQFLGLNVVGLRIFNYVCLASSIYLVNRILKRYRSKVSASFGLLLMAGYPVLFFTASTLYPQTLAGLLLVAAVERAARPERNSWDDLSAGILLGYLTMCISSFGITLPVFAAWQLHSSPQHRLRRVFIGLLPAVLLIGGWTARNWIAFDSFVFISTNSGVNLLVGNSPQTLPNAGRNIDISDYEAASQGMDEIQQDRYFRRIALDYIRADKVRFVRMYLLKLINYFNFRNELVTDVNILSLADLVMLASYGTLLSLALIRIGAARWYRVSELEWLLLCLYLVNGLVTAIFFTRIRFRLPFDLLLIVVDAMFLDWLVVSRTKRLKQSAGYVDDHG